jgi:hypothetical protein
MKAQYIVEQNEYDVPVSYELFPEDVEFDGPEDEGNFILNIPESKLKEAALAEGLEISEEKTIMYLDGENFAIETESEDMGKMTVVSDIQKGIMYIIMWSQKKVMQMTAEEMAKMEKESQNATDKMLQNIPPEMRKQVMEQMELEKSKAPVKYNARPTGKKMNLYGFNCEEYRVEMDEELISIWASSSNAGIAKEFERVSNKYDKIFKSDDEDIDEWKLVPGKVPVQVRTYSLSMMMGDPVLNIRNVTKIENKKPSPDKFRVPGKKEGFTKGSIQDIMMQMMPDEGQY